MPARLSIRESAPKPIKAIELAAMPAPTAIPNSTTCQAIPPQARSRARRSSLARSRDGSGGRTVPTRPTWSRSAIRSLLVTHVLEADIEQETDVGIVERVIDVSTLLAIADETARAEQAEVVGAGSLRQAGDGGKVTD